MSSESAWKNRTFNYTCFIDYMILSHAENLLRTHLDTILKRLKIPSSVYRNYPLDRGKYLG